MFNQIGCYTKTQVFINKGDKVLIDDGEDIGVVCGVFLPYTQAAKEWSCFDTGGLLIKSEKVGLILHSFGFFEKIEFLSIEDPYEKSQCYTGTKTLIKKGDQISINDGEDSGDICDVIFPLLDIDNQVVDVSGILLNSKRHKSQVFYPFESYKKITLLKT